jgi:hypothetical protein
MIDSVQAGVEQITDPGPFFSDYTVSYQLVAADNENPCHLSELSTSKYCYIGDYPKILVWQGDQVWGPSLPYGDSLFDALRAYYLPVYFTRNLFDYGTDLSIYDAIFATFGTSAYGHGMTSEEGAALKTFIQNGGNLYLEGADCWWAAAWFLTYNFLPWFGLGLNIGDGSEDLFAVTGQNDLSGYSFQYNALNVSMDELTPAFATPVFSNPDNNDILGVFYDDYGQGKTIGMVPAYAGLTDSTGSSSKLDLMCEYLEWFGINCNTGMEESAACPECVARRIEIYPNPTGGIVNCQLSTVNCQYVSLKLYDIHGREVAIVFEGNLPAGQHTMQFNASKMPAGIYIYRLTANGKRQTGKLVKF